MNDAGTATGYSAPYDPATQLKAWFVESGGTFQNLIIGYGAYDWRASSINAAGVVVGTLTEHYYAQFARGFIRYADGTEAYFKIPNIVSFNSYNFAASSVNDLNQIVGYYKDSAGYQHGYIRLPTNTAQANGLVPDEPSVEGDE